MGLYLSQMGTIPGRFLPRLKARRTSVAVGGDHGKTHHNGTQAIAGEKGVHTEAPSSGQFPKQERQGRSLTNGTYHARDLKQAIHHINKCDTVSHKSKFAMSTIARISRAQRAPAQPQTHQSRGVNGLP